MMVFARGEEDGFEADGAAVGRDVEAERFTVEAAGPFQIGNAQVYVTEANAEISGSD